MHAVDGACKAAVGVVSATHKLTVTSFFQDERCAAPRADAIADLVGDVGGGSAGKLAVFLLNGAVCESRLSDMVGNCMHGVAGYLLLSSRKLLGEVIESEDDTLIIKAHFRRRE